MSVAGHERLTINLTNKVLNINTLNNSLQAKSTITNIVIGIGIILFFNLILFPFLPKLIADTSFSVKNILDVRFSYSPGLVYSVFTELGSDGRRIYLLSEVLFDLPYAVLYGFIYAILIIKLYENSKNYAVKYLFLFPFGISLFDILENTGIILMLKTFPDINDKLVFYTSAFTSIKWIFAIIVAAIVLTGIIIKLKTYRKNQINRFKTFKNPLT